MKELLLVLVGGLCSVAGGFIAEWYRAQYACKIKLRETIGERKVSAYMKGIELIGQLRSILIQCIEEDAIKFLYKHGDWFAHNLILLPHTFVENWRSIRLNLQSSIRLRERQGKMPDGDERDKIIDKDVQLQSFCDSLAEEAETSIRKELGLPECKIKRPKIE